MPKGVSESSAETPIVLIAVFSHHCQRSVPAGMFPVAMTEEHQATDSTRATPSPGRRGGEVGRGLNWWKTSLEDF